MSYIVPNEMPKTCNSCPYGYLIMQNPLSSKTPIKRYRCQVGKAPWKTIDIDFYDDEYKDKDCPLVPMERILERLEEESVLAEKEMDRAREQNPLQYERCDSYICAIDNAIEIVKEEGGIE